MFKNFDKVFKYTFRNQADTKSYKSMMVIVSLILLALPIVIMLIVNNVQQKDDGKIKPSGASAIYVVNEEAPNTDFNLLNYAGIENYDNIKYISYDSVDEALEVANRGTDILVLRIYIDEGEVKSTLIVPESCTISKGDADNFNEFIDKNQMMFTVLGSGVSLNNLGQMSMSVENDVYNASGYMKGESLLENKEEAEAVAANSIKSTVNYIVVYVTMFVMYMVILMYGNSIAQNVVMEKESKLMDTMLVSVKPQALVFGKMLGILAAGFLQLFTWVISLVVGFIVGCKIVEAKGGNLGIISFIKSMPEMGIFTPLNIVLAILTILFGVLLYASLSCLAGAISNNREEAATNNSIFIVVLLASFYVVLFCGLGAKGGVMPLWMMFIPPVAAMVLPATLLMGNISMGLGLLAVLFVVLLAVVLTILAGKLYKMMSLYKGNRVKLSKAIGMLFSKA